MNFMISRNEFRKALNKVKGIPAKSSTVPVLNHLLLKIEGESIFITASDLEMWLRVNVKAEVFDEGSITIPAEPFFKIIDKLPDENVSLELQENEKAKITCGNVTFNVSGLSGEEYPNPPDDLEGSKFTISSKTLKGLLEKTLFAASKDESRHSMSGVRIEIFGEDGSKTIRMVATDGRRLAVSDTVSSNGVPVLEGITIPLKGSLALLRMAREPGDEIELSINGHNLSAGKNNERIVIRLIAEEFPNYKQAIEGVEGKVISSDRKALRESLERIL
ncbi:MAG: DNA polymerase III subunit beta, partial [Deltaproteobacteria bacterium]|nr:DNA polymerase III subunit beta [Deltaproteobacteria bacterium]